MGEWMKSPRLEEGAILYRMAWHWAEETWKRKEAWGWQGQKALQSEAVHTVCLEIPLESLINHPDPGQLAE